MSTNNNNLDETMVQALQFANMVMLEKSFALINWGQLALISSQNHNPTLKQPHKSNIQKPKNPSSTKSKFEKVMPLVKNKNQTNQSPSEFSIANSILNAHNTTNFHKTKHPMFLQNYIYSKVQGPIQNYNNTNYEEKYQDISLSSVPNQVNANNQPVHEWLTAKSGYNYDSSSSFVKGSSLQQSSYSVNDFLKQTSISLSRNLHHQQSSPITAWNHTNNKVNSIEKDDTRRNSHNEASSFKGITIDKPAGKTNNEKTKGTNKKPKFQKAKSKVSKANQSMQQDTPIAKLRVDSTLIKQQEQQLIARQYEYIVAQQKQQDFDLQTRATCELAPSKLQKLMEVENNKYKEMVLKTYFKHQK